MAEIRGRGRKGDQKMKPYLVHDYLMRYSDANHGGAVNEIRSARIQRAGALLTYQDSFAGLDKN